MIGVSNPVGMFGENFKSGLSSQIGDEIVYKSDS